MPQAHTSVAAKGRFGGLFAEDFDAGAGLAAGIIVLDEATGEPEIIAPAPTAAELEAVRADAYSEGLRSGLAQAAADRAEIMRQMLGTIAERMRDADRAAAEVADRGAGEVARLLLATLGRVLPQACARHGGAEVAALARAVLPALAQEPRITIRVSPHVLAPLQAELERLDPELRPRITVIPTDAMAPGDARIAWANGAATRQADAIWRDVAAVLAPLGLLDAPADRPVLEPAY